MRYIYVFIFGVLSSFSVVNAESVQLLKQKEATPLEGFASMVSKAEKDLEELKSSYGTQCSLPYSTDAPSYDKSSPTFKAIIMSAKHRKVEQSFQNFPKEFQDMFELFLKNIALLDEVLIFAHSTSDKIDGIFYEDCFLNDSENPRANIDLIDKMISENFYYLKEVLPAALGTIQFTTQADVLPDDYELLKQLQTELSLENVRVTEDKATEQTSGLSDLQAELDKSFEALNNLDIFMNAFPEDRYREQDVLKIEIGSANQTSQGLMTTVNLPPKNLVPLLNDMIFRSFQSLSDSFSYFMQAPEEDKKEVTELVEFHLDPLAWLNNKYRGSTEDMTKESAWMYHDKRRLENDLYQRIEDWKNDRNMMLELTKNTSGVGYDLLSKNLNYSFDLVQNINAEMGMSLGYIGMICEAQAGSVACE